MGGTISPHGIQEGVFFLGYMWYSKGVNVEWVVGEFRSRFVRVILVFGMGGGVEAVVSGVFFFSWS